MLRHLLARIAYAAAAGGAVSLPLTATNHVTCRSTGEAPALS